jgi:hypothetical protein
MKKITLTGYFMIQCFVLFAQSEIQKEADVRQMEVVEAEALLQKDVATLQNVWATNFMVNAPLNMVFIGGQIDLVKAGILSYSSFTRNVEQVMVFKDIVITMGGETVVPSGLDPLAGQSINRRYTNIWSKEKGKWVLVARHANDICSVNVNISSSQKVDNMPARFLNIVVQNNPTGHQFEIKFESAEQKIVLRIVDNNGRLIERRTIQAGTSAITIGESYRRGTYFAHFTDGLHSKTVKLVKL